MLKPFVVAAPAVCALDARRTSRQDPVLARPLPSESDIRADARAYMSEHPVPPRPRLEAPSQHAGGRARAQAADPSPTPRLPKSRMACPKKGWEQHHVFEAIDKNDVVALSDIRDKNFNLLLQAQPGTGTLPLKYAMNQGERAQVVTLTFVGFLSTWVNHLDEAALKKDDKRLLHALRTNLDIALTFGLETHKVELLASYVQILVMSEPGDWLKGRVETIGNAVRKRQPAEAFRAATAALDGFITQKLRQQVSEVSEYRNNAISDLVMMGCVQSLGPTVSPIPASAFGRDERVYNEFCLRLKDAKQQTPPLSAPLLKFCDAVENAMSRTHLGLSGKVTLLQQMCKA